MLKLIIVSAALTAFVVPAFAQSCESLYRQRNGIYANAGHCFRTARGRATYTNEGCVPGSADRRLSADQRAQVAAIARQERALGCR